VEFYIWHFYKNLSRTSKLVKIGATLHEDRYVYIVDSSWKVNSCSTAVQKGTQYCVSIATLHMFIFLIVTLNSTTVRMEWTVTFPWQE